MSEPAIVESVTFISLFS